MISYSKNYTNIYKMIKVYMLNNNKNVIASFIKF